MFKNLRQSHPEKKYPYAEIRNFTAGRMTRSFQKENDNNGTSSSSSDDEFTPKYKKSYWENINDNFNAFMDRICEELIKADNVLFKKRKIFPKFVLSPFHTQAAEEIIYPILNSGIRAMEIIQI